MNNLNDRITAINGLREPGDGPVGHDPITFETLTHEEVNAEVDKIQRVNILLDYLQFLIERIQQSVQGLRRKQ